MTERLHRGKQVNNIKAKGTIVAASVTSQQTKSTKQSRRLKAPKQSQAKNAAHYRQSEPKLVMKARE